MKELLVIGILTIILSSCSSTLQHDVIEINSDGKKIYNGQEVKSALSNYVSSEKVVIEVTRDVPFSAVRSTMEELKSNGIQNISITTLSKK